jgi:hypothetical protein
MDKIDKLIGRLATVANCTGKSVISMNLGGDQRLKNEIYKLITVDEILEIFDNFDSKIIDMREIAIEITELLKK